MKCDYATWLLGVAVALFLPATLSGAEAPPSFARDIRPILTATCFACHGPDEEHREADLRLDVREVALDFAAIVPGEPDESELVRRVFSDDADERMPPPDSGHSLTDTQKELLRRWIAAGAKYERHWAFVPPQRPPLPDVNETKNADWPRNEIDAFVLARLEVEGPPPSPEADRLALVRRLYLDLIGLPPSPEEADAFAEDDDPQAYEKLVDRLLASEHYGEHWARQWLDLARYADTNGYEKDRPRSIWPYRDWVIDAINDDMPFDEFTIHQLAGDMLPVPPPAKGSGGVDASDNPDADTVQALLANRQIATGFHRNTMLNEEGGIDPLEFRFYAMVDRVATTGTVWMGLTTGCAQCHSHKYDPLSHTDYYRLMALLNNADEPDLIVRDPQIEQRRRQLQEQIAELEAALPEQFPPASGDGPIEERRRKNLEAKFDQWLEKKRAEAVKWTTLRPVAMETNLPRLELLDDGSIFSTGDITKRDVFTLRFRLDEEQPPITALRLEVLPDDRLPARGPGRAYYEGRQGDFFLSELTAKTNDRPVAFASASHSYGKISIGSGNANAENVFDGNGSTGWSTAGGEGRPHQLVLNLKQPLQASGELEITLVFERHFAASLGRFRFAAASYEEPAKAKALPVEVEALLTRAPDALSEDDLARLRHYFLGVTPELADARKKIDQLRQRMPEFPTTLVVQERPADNPRPTFRHHRGEYLSPKEEVTPGVPAFLPPLPEDAPANRLSFARWLVSERNPLVGRVVVNRAWQSFFGQGLVRTPGDFGTQGELPTHPELLDWLAVQFTTPTEGAGFGWSRKRLHRLIVTSATYRQSSRVSHELLQRDPQNRLLARGPRFRVDAEVVRDIMLVASGLLSRKIGGPSVYPPQPQSVTGLAYGNFKWQPSQGADRYRRSLYTFKKRTAPFAAFAVFDAPTGENCTARRNRSNTPLQSLTLLNDEMFLEMARAMAKNAVTQIESPEARATYMFRTLLTRPPREGELSQLVEFQQAQLKRLQAGELDAAKILGERKSTAELASWFLVARALMNLDETITKQ